MPGSPVAVRHADVATSRLRTHVLTAGPSDVPVFVLVHGNVSSGRFFAPVMSTLAGQFRCLAPDLRGFGLSETVAVDARRGVRDFADDLHALITEGGLVPDGQPVHLLGWSLGGGVALQYAIDHPGAVASIVLRARCHRTASAAPATLRARRAGPTSPDPVRAPRARRW